MKGDNYLKFPLGLLRISENPCAFFNDAADFAAVNAGIGFQNKHEEDEWLDQFEHNIVVDNGPEANSSMAETAVLGASICKISLSDKSGNRAAKRYVEINRRLEKDITVKVASRFIFAASNGARCDAGVDVEQHKGSKRIDWREFRVLVALLSCPVNKWGFTVVGWEGVQHRSCGFYKREHFQEYADSEESWPDHCLPLTRAQIRHTLEKLESLRFFIRFRISEGDRGGQTAYSFKHNGDNAREKLAADVAKWQSFVRRECVREARAEDRLLQAKARAAFEEQLEKKHCAAEAILGKFRSERAAPLENADPDSQEEEEMPGNPHESLKPPSDRQVIAKGETKPVAKGGANIMRNPVEKSQKDKSPTRNTGTEQRIRAAAPPSEPVVEVVVKVQEESGYFIQDRFLTTDQATRLIADNRDRALEIIKTAKRGRLINGVFLPD